MGRPSDILNKQQKGRQQQQRFFEQFKSKPFWIWNKDDHKKRHATFSGRCCFNHMIGLPEKNGVKMPLFDYQEDIIKALEQHRRVYVLKATSLGLTTLLLRYMAWLCLKDDAMKSKNMVIVTGPRLELSVDLIRRMKALFPTVSFESKETVIELNGCRIDAFPSHSARALRGIVDVKFILADESDFWNDNETDEVRSVLGRMIPKSNPYIALVSTPNIPGGLMERIKNEPDDLCTYKRLYLPYTVGLGKIFRAEEIEQAKKLPSFDREFDLKFTGGIGDVHHLEDIDQAIRLGETMDPDVVLHDSQKCLGIDVGFGSSKTAMVLYQARDGKVQILYAKEYERPQQDDMIAIAADIYQRICNYSNLKIYVDGSNPGFIRELKAVVGDVVDYEWQIDQLRQKQKEDLIPYYMNVIPINFSRDGIPMLQNARVLLEGGLVAIHPKFSELILALKNAKATDDHLDKDFPFNDLYDAYRLAMWYVRPYHGEDEAANSGSVWALPTRRQQLEEYYRQRLVRDHNMRYLLDDDNDYCSEIWQ